MAAAGAACLRVAGVISVRPPGHSACCVAAQGQAGVQLQRAAALRHLGFLQAMSEGGPAAALHYVVELRAFG